jgi:hypothetical protein
MPNVNLVVGDDGSNFLQGSAGNDIVYGFNPNGPQSQINSITATRVATGLSQPLFATAPLRQSISKNFHDHKSSELLGLGSTRDHRKSAEGEYVNLSC